MSRHGQVKTEVDTAATEPKPKGKRGRKKKDVDIESSIKMENGALKQELITDHIPVVKKKRKIDRFNGMPEEEVLLMTLPDRLAHNLDILIIGINPGLFAAYIGHHYAGPGNHFWKCLYLSGLVPQPMNCYDDIKLQEYGIGFTNMCARTSRGSADLKKKEIEEGGNILKEKIKEYKPKIAVFNGKGIYEVFSGNKKFTFGKQAGFIEGTNTIAYVMPSSSARCSQLPRAIDKVPFYEALRRLRDYMVGRIPHLDESEVTFPTLELKTAVKKEDPGLTAENGEITSSSVTGNQNGGGGGKRGATSQSGSGAQVTVKKEATARGSGKGRGKRKGHQQEQNEDAFTVGETSGENQQVTTQADHGSDQQIAEGSNRDHPLMTKSYQGQQSIPQVAAASHLAHQAHSNLLQHTTGLMPSTLPFNPFSQVDFTSLCPTGSSSSHLFQDPSLPITMANNLPDSMSQDFMSSFYSGSHQFGMVGVPSVVASQQHNTSTEGNHTEKEPVKIKSEPVDPDPQH